MINNNYNAIIELLYNLVHIRIYRTCIISYSVNMYPLINFEMISTIYGNSVVIEFSVHRTITILKL